MLKIYLSTLSLRRTSAPPRKLFWVLGCWVVVCVKADYFPGAGGVGSLRLRPLFVPSIAVPSRPPRLFWIKSIYRPLAPLSSLPLSPPMMRRTHSFMAVLARLARVRHRGLRRGRGVSPLSSRSRLQGAWLVACSRVLAIGGGGGKTENRATQISQ